MKILFLSPNQITKYNWGHQLYRNEIGRQHNVVYYGSGFPKFNSSFSVKEIIKQIYGNNKPDLVMTYGWRYSKDFEGLGEIEIPKAHILVDYGRPEGIPKQNNFFAKNKYDLIFVISKNAERLMAKNNPHIKTRIIPFSVDTNIYKPLPIDKESIVLASFTTRSDVYPNRLKIVKAAKSLFPVYTKRIVHENLVKMINKCKVTVTSNNIFKSLSMRYTETMASGGFLMCDEPEDLKLLGFEDKKHLVIYNDISDFKQKLKYYMDPRHDIERNKIVKEGMNFVRTNHSCERRVKEMTQMINEELGI